MKLHTSPGWKRLNSSFHLKPKHQIEAANIVLELLHTLQTIKETSTDGIAIELAEIAIEKFDSWE